MKTEERIINEIKKATIILMSAMTAYVCFIIQYIEPTLNSKIVWFLGFLAFATLIIIIADKKQMDTTSTRRTRTTRNTRRNTNTKRQIQKSNKTKRKRGRIGGLKNGKNIL